MAASIEILVCHRPGLAASVVNAPFSVLTSSPPLSHRSESSLWQRQFDLVGGTLFHVGDPGLSLETRRYWAFEILKEISFDRYRFLPQYRKPFWRMLRVLLSVCPETS